MCLLLYDSSIRKRKGRRTGLRRLDGLRKYGQPAISFNQLRAELDLSGRDLRGYGQAVLDF